jgi:hypothetical protein
MTNIIQMEMTYDDNNTSKINVYENMDDIKDYVGKSNILESLNLPIMSRHMSCLTTSNFDAYKNNLKKFLSSPHSLLIVWG